MKKYILFGAGVDGERLYQRIGSSRIAYVFDNKKDVHWDDIENLDFATLRKIHADYKVIITPRNPHVMCEIATQLTQANIPYYFLSDIIEELLADDITEYKVKNSRDVFSYHPEEKWLLWEDRFQGAGSVMNNHYFWQDLWAARKVLMHGRKEDFIHFDIGSRIDGFVGHLMSFGQRVCILDVRPLDVELPGVEFRRCDATELDGIEDGSLNSLTALCSLEHFGLGRYGDPIDPEACFRCFSSIQRKLANGGIAYISVPIGREHVEFNAHRILSPYTIISSFPACELLEFSVTDGEGIELDVSPDKYRQGGDFASVFGMFMFRKK